MATKKHDKAAEKAYMEFLREKMGKDHIIRWDARYYIVFDKDTPDWEIVPGMTLSMFRTKESGDGFTRLETKLFRALIKVVELYKKPIVIKETYLSEHNCRYKHSVTYTALTEGSGIIFKPKSLSDMKALERACRKTFSEMGFYFFKDHILLESSRYCRWREVDPWGDIPPSYLDPIGHQKERGTRAILEKLKKGV